MFANTICNTLSPVDCMTKLSNIMTELYMIIPLSFIFSLSFIIMLTIAVTRKTAGKKLISKKIFWGIWLITYWLILFGIAFIPVTGYLIKKLGGF